MFHQVADAHAILRQKGVFKQAPIYAHNNQLFARVGSGFIKLYKFNQGTSNPNVAWETIDVPFELKADDRGVFLDKPVNHLKAVA